MAGIRRVLEALRRETPVLTRQAEDYPVLRSRAAGDTPVDPTGVPITALPRAASPEIDDVLAGVQSGTTSKFRLLDLLTWIKGQLSPSDIGAQGEILVSGILKGDGVGGVSAATPGTDYGTYSKPSGGIPEADMTSAVQTLLNKANTAYQKPSGGIPASDLANGVIPTVPSASTANPQMDGTASPGSTGQWADGGHVHPTDTSRAPAGYGLGVKLGTLTPIADANSTDLMTGWYATSASPVNTQNLPAGLSGDDKVGAIYAAVRGEYIYQEFYCNFRNLVYSRLRGWDTSLNDYAWTPWHVEASIDPNNPFATEQQIAFVETGTTASRAYAVGEYFCWQGLLYRVTAAISSGAAFTPGTNCAAQTVGEALTARAPAGYGLGVMTRDIGVSLTDCNDAAVTGWYDVAAGASNRPGGLSQYYQAVIYSVVRGPIYSYQEYYDFNTGKVYRRFKNTTWGAWAQI